MSEIIVKLNPDVQPSGSDLAVCNAARRSFNTRSDWEYDIVERRTGDDCWVPMKENKRLKEKDKRLIEFLARGMTADDFEFFKEEVQRLGYNSFNQQGTDLEGIDSGFLIEELWKWRNTPVHGTPFNHCHISFEVQAPIFVARHLVKHEYLVMSEFSRRYITDGVQFYEPTWRAAAENVKQGSGGPMDSTAVKPVTNKYKQLCKGAYRTFLRMLDLGAAPEQARMVLPQSTMTAWTWSGSLGAFAKMCTLRMHPDAQKESREVAEKIYSYLEEYYPVSAPALVKGV